MGPDDQAIISIEGDTITLGPVSRDLVPTYTRWMNDFTALRTLGASIVGPLAVEAEEAWYDKTARGEMGGVLFTIREKSTGTPVGNCGFNRIDQANRNATFGIMIGEASARGKGYGTEAARLMLDYGFHALGLHVVNLTCAEFNLAGRRAYEKAGFRECGRWRESQWFGGRYWDTVLMDCLASEFTGPGVLKTIFTADQDKERS